MPRRLIDISSPLKAGIKSDPPHALPKIEYLDHHQTAPAMAEYMGVRSTSCRAASTRRSSASRSARTTARISTRPTIISPP